MSKTEFYNKNGILCSQLDTELKKKLMQWFVWSVFLCGIRTYTWRKADMEEVNKFEMWTGRRMEVIQWTNKVIFGVILRRVGEKKAKKERNWIERIL